jgi:drug/metabolite transporter (DMT)-like permease
VFEILGPWINLFIFLGCLGIFVIIFRVIDESMLGKAISKVLGDSLGFMGKRYYSLPHTLRKVVKGMAVATWYISLIVVGLYMIT